MASNKPSTRLRELHGSGYEIKKGQPDIRGWDVRDDNRRKFGKVQELIFDIRANKVRYMVVNVLDTKELELEKRSVLVPIGLAELDAADDDVILSSVTPFQLRALPRYEKSSLGAKVERDISHVFGRTGVPSSASPIVEDDLDNSFYEHDHFNEDNMQKNRRGTAINPLNAGTAHGASSHTGSNHTGTGANATSDSYTGLGHTGMSGTGTGTGGNTAGDDYTGLGHTGMGGTGTGTRGNTAGDDYTGMGHTGMSGTGTGAGQNNLDTNSERLRNHESMGNRTDEDPLVPGRTSSSTSSDNVIYRSDLSDRNETDEDALRRLRQKGDTDETNSRAF